MNLDATRFLRRALLADGITCGASGLALVALPGPIAAQIGLSSAGTVAGVGVSLLLCAVFLVRNARRETPRRDEAVLTVALNLAWVLGSLAVVAAGLLNREANWALVLVGDVVLAFAALEGIGLRRMAALTGSDSRA